MFLEPSAEISELFCKPQPRLPFLLYVLVVFVFVLFMDGATARFVLAAAAAVPLVARPRPSVIPARDVFEMPFFNSGSYDRSVHPYGV